MRMAICMLLGLLGAALLLGGCERTATRIARGVMIHRWAPDSSAVYYLKDSRTGPVLCRYDVATGKVTRYPQATVSGPFAVSPDGTRIAYARGKKGVFCHTLATGVTTNVFTPSETTEPVFIDYVSWLPNDTLMITQGTFPRAFRVGLLQPGSNTLEFLPLSVSGGEFRLQPDDSGFSYLGEDWQYHYFDLQTRTDTTLTAINAQQLIPFALFGSKVLAVTYGKMMWYDLQTKVLSEPLPLVPLLYAGQLSPDGTRIVYVVLHGNGDPLITRPNELFLEEVPAGVIPD